MSLRDEIEGRQPPTHRLLEIIEGKAACSGDGLTDSERAELVDIVRDKEVPHAVLETLLRKRGYTISASSIARYRKTLHEPWR